MTNTSRLPAREPPLAGESLTSLVRRTAVTMGYESVHRLRGLITPVADVPYHLEHLAPGPAMLALATLLGQGQERLVALTVHRHAAQLVLVPKGQEPAAISDTKTTLRYFNLAAPRICSSCLAEEMAYERLARSFRPVSVCRKHACWLLACCPQCQRAFRRDRLDIRPCGCGCDLAQTPSVAASSRVMGIAGAIESWFHDSDPPLVGMSMAACFWWLDRLATAATRTPSWLEQAREGLQVPSEINAQDLAWLCAAEILLEWPGRLEAFLDVFQTVDKPHASTTGVGRSFGRLLREAWHLEQLGFTAPADVLRSYLLARYSRGHLSTKVCLFRAKKHRRLVGDRHWMSQTHAARRLHLRHAAIPDLVARGGLVGHVHTAGRRTVGLISRESVESLERHLSQSISAENAAERLGIGRHRVLDLIHAELLSGCVRTSDGWRIPLTALKPLEDFYSHLPVSDTLKSGWMTAQQATRDFGPHGVTFVALLKGVLDGKIRAAHNPRERDYRVLLVHQADLQRYLPTIQDECDQAHGYPLTRLARVLVPGQPLKETVLRKWIDAGLLCAGRTAKRWWIQHEEVARFRATYCLAREACELLGISRSTLARWEREGKVRPAYSRRLNTGAGASVFRRADIERLRHTPMAA